MENLLGWSCLFVVFGILCFIKIKNFEIRSLLITAFLLRVIFVILDQYELVKLPDSYGDSWKFEEIARKYSRDQGFLIILDFLKTDSFLISRIISIFYTIFYESKMMAQIISVILGTTAVYLVYYLCLLLWDSKSAKKAAWVAALFPSLILYSSLTLREVYIVFILLIGLIGVTKFFQKNSPLYFLQSVLSFYILTFFHGPLAIGGFIFLFYLVLRLIKNQLYNLYNLKINIYSFILILLSILPIILFLNNTINIPYVGGVKILFNLDVLITKINYFIQGSASYPNWFIINNKYELFTKTTIKLLYFLYSPFIWDVKTPLHAIGLIDAILYFMLTVYVIKNRKEIFSNPVTRFFLLLFICYLIIYGISVGNIGTGIRHRSKFVILLIILAAPKIHRFIIFKKLSIN